MEEKYKALIVAIVGGIVYGMFSTLWVLKWTSITGLGFVIGALILIATAKKAHKVIKGVAQ